jgi:hypothetical protein
VLVHLLLSQGLIYLGVAMLPAEYFRAHPSALVPVGILIGIGQVGGVGLWGKEGRVGATSWAEGEGCGRGSVCRSVRVWDTRRCLHARLQLRMPRSSLTPPALT